MSENENEIQWLRSKRESKNGLVHAVSYGVECSRCKKFQSVETRYCADCGGKFNGELPKIKTFERRQRKWHDWKD